MQHDGLTMILARTEDLSATLAIISRHGAASATLFVRRLGDELALELLCPPHVTHDTALTIGAALAAAGNEVSIKTVRRLGANGRGPAYRLEERASWARTSHWKAAA